MEIKPEHLDQAEAEKIVQEDREWLQSAQAELQSLRSHSVPMRKSALQEQSLEAASLEIERLSKAAKQDIKSLLVPFLGGFVLSGMGATMACIVVVAAVPLFHSLFAIPAVLAIALFAGMLGGIYAGTEGPSRLNHFRLQQHTIQMRLFEMRLHEDRILNGNSDEQRDGWQRLVVASDEIQKSIATMSKQIVASRKIKNLTNGERTLIANASEVAAEAEQITKKMLQELDPNLSKHPALAYDEALSQANSLQAIDIQTDRLIEGQ